MRSARSEWLPNRRTALGLGAGALVSGGLLSACTSGDSTPDPLIALADSAKRDAAEAEAAAKAHPELAAAARAVAKARREQEAALRKEINRAAASTETKQPGQPEAEPPAGGPQAASQSITKALRSAEQSAAALIETLPNYRAGLVGSVAAGCAALRELFT